MVLCEIAIVACDLAEVLGTAIKLHLLFHLPLVTRWLAVLPTAILVAAKGDRGAAELVILSQGILSLQLPFAVVPLVSFTGGRDGMDRFANPR